MFVKDNKIKSVINYFKEKLAGSFSEGEIKFLTNLSLQSALQISKTDLLLSQDKTVSESDLLRFRSIIKDLLLNKPIQYILGETEFFGLSFKVDENVLIPRPETEEIVSIIIKENKKIDSLIDIGTGSGCIPLALKSKFPETNIFGLDVSENALKIAKENAKYLNLEVEFVLDDILKPSYQFKAQFDVIVSNPPYVLESDKAEMNANVLEFEPHLALFVEDKNPLLFYHAILQFSQKNLKNGGKVYFEIHESMGSQIKKLFLDFSFSEVEIRKDFYGKDRLAIGKK